MSNKYQREIKPGVFVDVYDVLQAWRVTNPALQHLVKKALAPGQRGHKTRDEDLRDIQASARRAVELQADRIEINMPAMDEVSGEPAHTCWLPLNPNIRPLDYMALGVIEEAPEGMIRVPCDADGWVEWSGGIRPPVPRDTRVDIELVNGMARQNRPAGNYLWAGPSDLTVHITRFRLAKQEASA